MVFFAVSGFLVAGSYARNPELRAFVIARGVRIWPALFAAAAVSALVIGGSTTTMDAPSYYLSPDVYWYVAANSALLTTFQYLPGVFSDNPFPVTVNGSLWSLPLEVFCYGLLYAAGRIGLLQPIRCLWFVSAGLMVSIACRAASLESPLPQVLPSFLAGLAFYVFRLRVPASWLGLMALVAICFASRDLLIHPELVRVTIAYGALTFGTGVSGAGRFVGRGSDYSYGMYLYEWPITQAIVFLFPTATFIWVLMAALVVSSALAVASWHLIEAPVLRRRNYFLRSPAQVAVSV